MKYTYRIEVTNDLDAYDALTRHNIDSIAEDEAVYVNPWLLATILDILRKTNLLKPT